MATWLYGHRRMIYKIYIVIVVTITAVLQILESSGHL